jgi:LysR family transcriptional regulator, hydrogen peroxide-inducible genes activator
MISLSQLEYVAAVARHRHFGKAADACHISQPSLSMQILKAEQESGFSFFDRLQRPIGITEKGRAFVAQATVVLQEHDRLRQVAQADSGDLRGALRLGVIPTLAPYLVPLFIKKFAQRCPEVHLHIEELPTALLVNGLREERLDAAIAATPLRESGLVEKTLFYESFYLYAHRDNPLLKKTRLLARDLKRKDIWLLADGHCLRNQVSRLCASAPAHPAMANVIFEGGTLETLRQSIRHTGGATLVPELFVSELAREERAACVRPFGHPVPSRQISLLCRSRAWKTRLVDALENSIHASLPPALIDKNKRRVLAVGL